MFIFKFKSHSSLITKIVISGPYLTIYYKKQMSQELNSTINHCGFGSIIADSPEHVFCHNPFVNFSAKGDSIPHKHLTFPPNANRANMLQLFFNMLFSRQSDYNFRKHDYKNFVQRLNEERKSYGHKQFPEDVQKVIDDFDISTPFVLKEEAKEMLVEFSMYLNDAFNSCVESIIMKAYSLLNNENYFKIISREFYYHEEAPVSLEAQSIRDYYNSLLKLREIFLVINVKKDKAILLQLYYEAKNIINGILKNENCLADFQFYQNILYLSHYITKQTKSLEFHLIMKYGLINSSIATAVFLFTAPLKIISVPLGLVVGFTSVIGSIYIQQPLTNAINATFFGNKKDIRPDISDKQDFIVYQPLKIRKQANQ